MSDNFRIVEVSFCLQERLGIEFVLQNGEVLFLPKGEMTKALQERGSDAKEIRRLHRASHREASKLSGEIGESDYEEVQLLHLDFQDAIKWYPRNARRSLKSFYYREQTQDR